MSWGDARKACQRYGGDLLIIQDDAEQKFIAANRTAAQRLQHHWIGLTDQETEGMMLKIRSDSFGLLGCNF